MRNSIDFNVSHSGGMAVFVFAKSCPLGVDLEELRAISDMQNIAIHFFCTEEVEELMSLPTYEHELGLFRCWTRKEGYIKATGDGLTTPLNSFRVNLLPNGPPRLVHVAGDPSGASDWTLIDIRMPFGFASAMAYYGESRPHLIWPVITTLTLWKMVRRIQRMIVLVHFTPRPCISARSLASCHLSSHEAQAACHHFRRAAGR